MGPKKKAILFAELKKDPAPISGQNETRLTEFPLLGIEPYTKGSVSMLLTIELYPS
jgi:hypothetical protein